MVPGLERRSLCGEGARAGEEEVVVLAPLTRSPMTCVLGGRRGYCSPREENREGGTDEDRACTH